MTGQAGFIEETLLFLLAAVIIVPLFQRVRASPVLGYLIAGAIIGPFGFGLVHDTGGARALAELGIAFLMFTVGLELSLERLRTMRHLIFGIGLAQVAITTVAVAAVAWGLGLPVETAVIIGAALALSSTAIVLRLLSDKGELLSRSGRVVLSILLLQDLAVVPFLALLPALADPTTSLPVAVALTMVRAAAALVVILVLGRLVLRPLLRTVAAAGNPEIFSALVLLVALGTGWATHQAGLSLALGAFLAGLLLAETEYRHQIEADIEPYRGILLGLFFMTIGMLVDGATAIASAGLIVLALIGLLLGKAVLITAIALAFRQPLAIAARTGIVLAQGGEFAFILFALALSQGLMEPALGQILVVVVALSMMLTPGLALLAERVARLLERRRGFGPADMAEEMQGITGVRQADLHHIRTGRNQPSTNALQQTIHLNEHAITARYQWQTEPK
ncbi:MAG: monovalent cation:proton antiporter-2 (CPA2) family protein, partial [Alphaproteobacteria bacterium]